MPPLNITCTTQEGCVKFLPKNRIDEVERSPIYLFIILYFLVTKERENTAVNSVHYFLSAGTSLRPICTKSGVSEIFSQFLFQCLGCTQGPSYNITYCTPSILLYCTNSAWPSLAFEEYKVALFSIYNLDAVECTPSIQFKWPPIEFTCAGYVLG